MVVEHFVDRRYGYLTDGDRCKPDASRGIQCCQPSKSCKN
jgi:hypothetical protein